MTRLITPTINLNGNTAEDLTTKLSAVLAAIRVLEQALVDANDVTHGRNFQTSRTAFEQMDAWKAWRERQLQVAALAHDVSELTLNIHAQKRSRREA